MEDLHQGETGTETFDFSPASVDTEVVPLFLAVCLRRLLSVRSCLDILVFCQNFQIVSCQGCVAESAEGKALNLKIEGSTLPCTHS